MIGGKPENVFKGALRPTGIAQILEHEPKLDVRLHVGGANRERRFEMGLRP